MEGGDSCSEHDGEQFDDAEGAQEGGAEAEDAEQPDQLRPQRRWRAHWRLLGCGGAAER